MKRMLWALVAALFVSAGPAVALAAAAGEVVFSAPSGTFTGSVTVSLTSGAGGAQIRYTTDGSVPSGQSTVSTGPLTLTGTTQLRAQAYVSGAAAGPTATRIYVKRAVDAANNDLPILLLDDYV